MPNPTAKGFGGRLRAAMLASGIETSRRLAVHAGVTPQAVLKWLNMETAEISTDHLAKLADVLNVRMKWLATGKGSPVAEGLPEAVKALLSAQEPTRTKPQQNTDDDDDDDDRIDRW